MNSLFYVVYAMAHYLRLLTAIVCYFCLFTWDYSVSLVPWTAVIAVAGVFMFQGIEDVSKKQYEMWKNYLGDENVSS